MLQYPILFYSFTQVNIIINTLPISSSGGIPIF